MYSPFAKFGASDGQGYDTYRPNLFGNVTNKNSLHSNSPARVPLNTVGKSGLALQFDGMDDFLYSHNRIGAKGASPDETFLIVCEFDSSPSEALLLGYASSAFSMTYYSRAICVTGGTIRATGCNASDGKVINSSIAPVAGKVYTIAARMSASGGLFINGSKIGAGNLSEAWEYMFSIGASGGLQDMATCGAYPFPGKVYFAAAADGGFSDPELCSLTANPWQLFEPQRLYIPIDSAAAPQLLAPTGQTAGSTWIASNGGALYTCVDETVSDEADYTYTTTPGAWEEFTFPDGGSVSASGGFVRYNIPAGSGAITVELRQGASVLETWGPHALTGSLQTFSQSITASTSDSNDLRVRFTAA